MPSPSLPFDPRAEAVFREYLARVDAGEPADFEAICRSNPTLERGLRRLRDAAEVMDRLGPSAEENRPLPEPPKVKLGPDSGPTSSLEDNPRSDSDASNSLFDKLRVAGARGARYKPLGEVARGGMGVILKVWDDELRRTLAMKVVLGRANKAIGETPQVDPMVLGRFLEEAQITGQLDHPGIVPVHELGLGTDGRLYFTMRLVRGEDLSTIFQHVHKGEEGWTQVRALNVILKVCEAMSFAHSKKVIHRDLKPANVMVGKFGEVYVMDWGVARLLGREDKHDLRIRTRRLSNLGAVNTDRSEWRDDGPESPVVTMDGDIIGTPCFMSPEQAKGQLKLLGPHSDVYAVGAMLYALLSGETPYVPPETPVSVRDILNSVLRGPPSSLSQISPQTSGELVAIVEKAMAREIAERYPTMQELADDLRDYLEGRVVGAYETGTWAETRKWVRRNKSLSASLAATIVILIAGIVTSTVFGTRARERAVEALAAKNELKIKNTELEGTNAALAVAKTEADAKTQEAARNAGEAIRLKNEAMVREEHATARADALWVIQELREFEKLDDEVSYLRSLPRPAHEWWLGQAQELIDGRPAAPARGLNRRPGLVDHQKLLEEIRAFGTLTAEGDAAIWQFGEDREKQWWNAQLTQLESNLIDLRERIRVAEQSVRSNQSVQLWKEAIRSISESPVYSEITLSPQLELLPIGADPQSGLWEFVHIPTGEPPERLANGSLVLKEGTGLVFVLLPGGRVPHEVVDGSAAMQDAELTDIDLDPFFLSKYEMTREQWTRIARNWTGTFENAGPPMLPASYVSWDDCQEQLGRAGLGLGLPSEAQWEYGCRGGTTTIWWTGNTEGSLARAEYVLSGPGIIRLNSIGRLRANPFGLYDIHGNVSEWCQDTRYSSLQPRAGDGLRYEPGNSPRLIRGDGATGPALRSRSANREGAGSGFRGATVGLRPSRLLMP